MLLKLDIDITTKNGTTIGLKPYSHRSIGAVKELVNLTMMNDELWEGNVELEL